eukprot:1377108-Alexandrium_andersonii.AAC.1
MVRAAAASPATAPPPAAAMAPAETVALPTNGRIYLRVPFTEKDEAKARGAKWDPGCKKWYASCTEDFARLTKWSVAGANEWGDERD